MAFVRFSGRVPGMHTRSVLCRILFCLAALKAVVAFAAGGSWRPPRMVEPARVEMGGEWGRSYQRGVERIGRDPFTAPFVLADVNFGVKRWFINYSGDTSGRFLELASLTCERDHPEPGFLPEVLDQITRFQKADGHFGVDVDWSQPIDFDVNSDQTRMMPILWGNGRLLLGLLAAYDKFGDSRLLDAARKLGDFYGTVVVERFCDPKRIDEYRKRAAYAANFVTCTFEGMEGLVQLYRATHEPKHLRTARRMADFHEAFDTLPVDHSHGSLSQHRGLLLLYEATGDARYFQRVTNRWQCAVDGGYINPAGGVLEKFWVTGYDRDEGCSEADWLRLNLMLWRLTGETRYLDMAERLMHCAYPATQWPSGGFGHRTIGCDDVGPVAFKLPYVEALWCCGFHGALGLHDLKGYLAVGATNNVLFYNFPVEFKASVDVGGAGWRVSSEALPTQVDVPVRTRLTLAGDPGRRLAVWLRVPDWAERVEVRHDGHLVATAGEQHGYARLKRQLPGGSTLEISYYGGPYLEDRRCRRLVLPEARPVTLAKVVVRHGPSVLVNSGSGDVQGLVLRVGRDGRLQWPPAGGGDSATRPVPWSELSNPREPHAFLFNARLEKQR